MNQLPTPRSWTSTLLGTALTILFASIAVSWSIMILQSITTPLMVIIGVIGLVWAVATIRRRHRHDDW